VYFLDVEPVYLLIAHTLSNIYEEILVVDEIGLLGSIGGSLGLFIGFSFFWLRFHTCGLFD